MKNFRLKKFMSVLGTVAAVIAATVSCSNKVKELAGWWDGHDFSSTENFRDINAAEDKFEGFLELLLKVPYSESVPTLNEFLDSAAKNPVAYTVWAGWFEACLHAPDSPYREDCLFTVWLDKSISDSVLDDYLLEHLVQLQRVTARCRIGNALPDVTLRTDSGKDVHLKDLTDSTGMLIFLADANCPSCIENMNSIAIKGCNPVAILVNGNQAAVEAVASKVSPAWTVTYAPGREIEEWQVFDISTLPYHIIVSPDGKIKEIY